MGSILLVSYAGLMGGAERMLLDFAIAAGEDAVVACPEGPLAAAARERGIAVLAGPTLPLELRGSLARRASAVRALVAHGRRVRQLVAAVDPELVTLCGMRTALAGLGPGRLAAPAVVDHHDLLPGGWVATAIRRAMRHAALIVVPSRAIAEDLGPVDVPVEVVPAGVELARFHPSLNPLSPPVVLVLSALVRWKRPELAIAAVAHARAQAPELASLRLRLAGAPLDADGEQLIAELSASAAAAGVPAQIGPASDVPGELAAASCLLHCADREPFGIALIEALAAGRPVVAPDAGGPPEILDPSCGMLYPPGDAAAAGEALAHLLADPERARATGAAGRARAAARFDNRKTRRWFLDAIAPLRDRPDAPAAPAGTGLAVVTVSHNSAPELRTLLRSVSVHLPGAKVIVADSASSDDSVAVAEAAGAQVLALENRGFGAACNRALAAVDVPVCALLNPDVVLLDDSLAQLIEPARSGERLLAPLVLSPDGSRQDNVHPLPGSGAELARSVLPYTRLPLVWLAPWRARRARPVGWAIAAALLGSTELLRRLGPFDEQIFLYAEDLDLALRAREIGVATWFDPRARVVHHGGHTMLRAFGGEPVDRLARTRREVVARRMGRAALRRDTGAAALRYLTRIAAHGLLGHSTERERSQLRALWR